MTDDLDLMNLERKTTDAMAVAGMRGYALPAEYEQSTKLLHAAEAVLNDPAPATHQTPNDPAKVPAWIAKSAAERIAWREARAVASDLAAHYNRERMRTALAAVPQFARKVIEEFEELLPRFVDLAARAPRDVSGHTTTEEFTLHAELLRTVDDLTRATLDRGRLALLIDDEAEAVGADGLWLVLNPSGNASLEAVHEALRTFRGRVPMTLEDWLSVLPLGLKMAGPGDVAARRLRLANAQAGSAKAADGGMIDKTIDQALSNLGTA